MSTTSLCPSATREHGPGAKRVLPLLFLTCLLDAAGVGLIVPQTRKLATVGVIGYVLYLGANVARNR